MHEFALLVYLCGSPFEPACHWHLAGRYRNETTCIANGMVFDLDPFPKFKCERSSPIPLPRPRPAGLR